MTPKFAWRAVLIAGLLTALAVVHWTKLDSLAWHSWKIARLPAAIPGAINLKRYRVDIEARPLKGLDDDVSALTYNPDRDTLFTVLNGKPEIVEMTLEGEILRRVRVTGASDLEGLTHVARDRYVIAEERKHRLWIVRIGDGTRTLSLDDAPGLTLAIDLFENKGFEGLSYHAGGRRLLVVKESNPLRLLAVSGFVEHDPRSPFDVSITEVESPQSPRLFVGDLSSLTVEEASGHLLLLSDASKLVVEYDETGRPISMLPLWRGFRGLKASVPQAEGLAMDSAGRVYIVSEPNLFYRFTRRENADWPLASPDRVQAALPDPGPEIRGEGKGDRGSSRRTPPERVRDPRGSSTTSMPAVRRPPATRAGDSSRRSAFSVPRR